MRLHEEFLNTHWAATTKKNHLLQPRNRVKERMKTVREEQGANTIHRAASETKP